MSVSVSVSVSTTGRQSHVRGIIQSTAGLVLGVSGVDMDVLVCSSTDRELRALPYRLLIGWTRPHAGTGGTTRR